MPRSPSSRLQADNSNSPDYSNENTVSGELENFEEAIYRSDKVNITNSEAYPTSPAEYKMSIQSPQRGRHAEIQFTEIGESKADEIEIYDKNIDRIEPDNYIEAHLGDNIYALNVKATDSEVGRVESWVGSILDNFSEVSSDSKLIVENKDNR